MAKNNHLNKAKRVKNDEFYTQYDDIVKELTNYAHHFKDKHLLFPCDDPFKSEFFNVIKDNFTKWGIRKATFTCYNQNGKGKKLVYERGAVSFKYGGGIGDGDFRNKEVTQIRDTADIIITNPPFSLLGGYFLKWLLDSGKKFLIIAPNTIYKNILFYNAFINRDVWLGINKQNRFKTPNKKFADVHTVWLTNLKHNKTNPKLPLLTMAQCKEKFSDCNEFNNQAYIPYANIDAIEVSKVKWLPSDYKGIMGVPISFLEKYNPDQFEILGCTDCNLELFRGFKNISQNFINIVTQQYKAKGLRLPSERSYKRDCFYVKRDGTVKEAFARYFIKHKF